MLCSSVYQIYLLLMTLTNVDYALPMYKIMVNLIVNFAISISRKELT